MSDTALKKAGVGIVGILTLTVGFLWFLGKNVAIQESLSFSDGKSSTVNASSTAPSLQGSAAGQQTSGENHTEQLAQTVFTTYLENQAAHGTSSPATLKSSIQSSFNNSLKTTEADVLTNYKPYTLSDLHIISQNDNTALKRYAYETAQIAANSYYSGLGSEYNIYIKEAAQPGLLNSQEAAAKLTRASKAYAHIVQGLVAMQVPSSEASQHLDMTNAYLNLSKGLQLMAKSSQDPLVGVVGVKLYVDGYTTLTNLDAYGT